MKLSEDTLHFNKELVYGELGAIISGPGLSVISSLFSTNPKIISFSAVIGSLLGSVAVWITMRIAHGKERGDHSAGKLAKDIMYFTPFAFTVAMLVYQPILYFLSHSLLVDGHMILTSVIFAQIIAFTTFLIILNIYRALLIKAIGRRL